MFGYSPVSQREAAEGESKNVSEAKKRVAENESSATMAEASYRAEAHVGVSGWRDVVNVLQFLPVLAEKKLWHFDALDSELDILSVYPSILCTVLSFAAGGVMAA